jgi:flagellar motor switch protein FliG
MALKKTQSPLPENPAPGISGAEKAAIFLMSIDPEQASAILGRLEEKDIRKLTNYASRLSNVPDRTVARVKEEFCRSAGTDNPLAFGQTRDKMKSLLGRAMGADRAAAMTELLDKNDAVYEGIESLKWLDPETIAGFLRNEHPQTLALVLAHLEPAQAAAVIQLIPASMQSGVLERLATLDRINPKALAELDQAVKTELLASGAAKSVSVGGIDAAAEIVANLGKEAEANLFRHLDSQNPGLADDLRGRMFAFEDLEVLNDHGMQRVLSMVSDERLTLALKTAGESMKKKILRNVSARAAELIQKELETMGPVKLSDVEHAQQEIVKISRRLEADGLVAFERSGETFV